MSNIHISRRFGFATPGRAARRRHANRPAMDMLEARQLLAARVSIGNATVVTEGNLGTTTRYAEFRVAITDGSSSATYTVDYSTVNNSAQAGTDFSLTSGRLTFKPVSSGLGGSRFDPQTIRVPILSDRVGEGTETFFAKLTAVGSNLTVDNALGQGTIEDDDRPTVSLTPPTLSIAENGGQALLTVSLSNPSDLPVRVNFKTVAGTAEANLDYKSVSQLVTFNPRETSKVIPVTIVDDALYERASPESFQVQIEGAVNASLGNAASVVSIVENDPPPPPVPAVSIATRSATVAEGAVNAQFYVSLSNKYNTTVSVRVLTSNGTAKAGSDFVGQSFTLTFKPGETDAGFSVPIVNDAAVEPNETFQVVLSAPVGATLGVASAAVTIEDDDVAVVRDSPGVYRAGTFYHDMDTFGYQSSDPTSSYGGFNGDRAVAGDWDGDGYDEPGIFRIVNGAGYFYLDTGAAGYQATDAVVAFGRAGDVPVIGDWDGDGKDNVGVFQNAGGVMVFVLDIGTPGYQATDRVVQFGLPGDQPIIGRWKRR